MLILGVDIAARADGKKNCGLALIDASRLTALDAPGDDLIWTRAIDGTDLRTVAAVIAEVKAHGAALPAGAMLDSPAGAMLALERQFVGMDPGMTEKLVGTRVRFETVAAIRGVPFELFYPATWQTILKVLGEDLPTKLSKPKKPKAPKVKKGQPPPEPAPAKAPRLIRDTKAAARLLVSRLYPGVKMGPDECDAVLIARYAGWQRRASAGQPAPTETITALRRHHELNGISDAVLADALSPDRAERISEGVARDLRAKGLL
jgi:hypothetical protein